jgi:hypothetical protein
MTELVNEDEHAKDEQECDYRVHCVNSNAYGRSRPAQEGAFHF